MRVREQRQTLEALSEVSRALASALSLPEFFFLAIRATARAIGAFKGNIWRFDEASGHAVIEAAYNVPPDQVEAYNRQFQALSTRTEAPTLTAIRTRKVVLVSDFPHDEQFAEFRVWARDWGFASAAFVPLIYADRAIGSLSLYFPEPMAFDENDALFLETVAAQVATAMVANERLSTLQEVNEDLVHRREEVEALSSQSAQFRLLETIFEELPAGVTFLDGDLKVRMANPAFLRSLGLTLEDVRDCPVSAITGMGAAELEGILRRVLAVNEPFHADNFAFTLRGRPELGTRYWDLTCLPLGDIVGDQGVLVLSLDVTERQAFMEGIRRQVRELEALDDMKDNFLAIVSHELRTPLNFITGFASILEDEIMGTMTLEQHTYLQRILEGADRLLEIITNMLTFNRLQSGKVTLFPEALDIGPFVGDLVERSRPKALEKQIEFACDLAPDLPPVCADAESLERVLTQLVDNAIKFTPEGGRITVRACPFEGGRIRLEVADTGIGIAEAVIPKLFTRFFQADMSPTRQFGGTGLGLAIAKRLVELLHGDIGVESKLGKGSTFWLTLPEAHGDCQ